MINLRVGKLLQVHKRKCITDVYVTTDSNFNIEKNPR
jgi:hypothetical protein